MLETTYSAARAVASTVRAHLADHLRAGGARGESPLADVPSEDVIAELIAAAFWASLRREEGHDTKVSIAFADTHHTENPLRFERPLAIAPGVLTKLAIAVE